MSGATVTAALLLARLGLRVVCDEPGPALAAAAGANLADSPIEIIESRFDDQ